MFRALASVGLFAGLSRGAVGTSSVAMPTAAKKAVTKKAATPARRVFRRSATARPLTLATATAPTGPIAPPPAKARAGDLLKIKDFGKGVDWSVVASAVADRAR